MKPYYAVIFTSKVSADLEDYAVAAKRMIEIAESSKGFLGVESARSELGITVSYWSDLTSINEFKRNSEHKLAQSRGREKWYLGYRVRICKVERDYDFGML